MEEGFGPTYVSLLADDNTEITLEYVSSVELNGCEYRSFFEVSGTPLTGSGESDAPDAEDTGTELIILKVMEENGEEILSTCDTDEEEAAAFEAFMQDLYDDEDEDGADNADDADDADRD